jgi:hypothetical protein
MTHPEHPHLEHPIERAPYPHCDSRVLHAPGECRYCDEYPDQQLRRIQSNINFTGHHDPDKALCPAERLRPIERINRWPGNTAKGYTPEPEAEQLIADLTALAQEPRRSRWRRLLHLGGN